LKRRFIARYIFDPHTRQRDDEVPGAD